MNFIPSVVTVDEAAFCARLRPCTIREHLRSGQLEGEGRPWRIPVRALAAYGVTMEDVPRLLTEFARIKADSKSVSQPSAKAA